MQAQPNDKMVRCRVDESLVMIGPFLIAQTVYVHDVGQNRRIENIYYNGKEPMIEMKQCTT